MAERAEVQTVPSPRRHHQGHLPIQNITAFIGDALSKLLGHACFQRYTDKLPLQTWLQIRNTFDHRHHVSSETQSASKIRYAAGQKSEPLG